MLNDSHIHFFSPSFFAGLGATPTAIGSLGWEYPDTVEALAAQVPLPYARRGIAGAF